MADDKPEDAGLAPDVGRAKRTPPTIDLEATEVSTQPQEAAVEPEAAPAPDHAEPEQVKPDPIDAERERIEAQASASSISASRRWSAATCISAARSPSAT